MARERARNAGTPRSAVIEFQISSSRFHGSKARTAAEERADWFFEFLRADLDSLTPGQMLGYRRDLVVFTTNVTKGLITDDDQLETVSDTDPGGLVPEARLRSFQAEARDGLDRVVRGDTWTLPKPITFGLARAGDYLARVDMKGPLATMFTAAAIAVIEETWFAIKACERCRNWFRGHGKQRFCSEECSRRERWDRFKSRRPARDYRQERQRAVKRKRLKVGRRQN